MNDTSRSDSGVTRGFFLAGAVNVFGMLVVSKLFTNSLLSATDPVVFSSLGQVAVVLWGFAYWAVSKSFRFVPHLLLVFCVEKMVYVGTWLLWLSKNGHSLKSLASESLMTAVFFGVYGAGDFVFGLFFGWVAVSVLKGGRDTAA